MKPELKYLSPILWTKDLQETIEFYTDTLGFSAQSNFPNFVSLSRGHVEIMFVVPQDDSEAGEVDEPFFPRPLLTGSLYINVKHVDQLWEEFEDKAEVLSPLCDREYWMRDFSIRDNNGYELVFGESIPYNEQVP